MRKLDDDPVRTFGSYLEAYSPGKRLITSEILCLESSEMTLQTLLAQLPSLTLAFSHTCLF